MAQETEIKIPVADIGLIRERLEQLAARRLHGPHRERNTVFDTADHALRSSGRTLRARTSGNRHTLTLKGPATFDGAVKTREEIEVGVDDAQLIEELLAFLDYTVVARYEKDREEWRLGGTIVCLDHTPMGDFVELEGPPDGLASAASSIGLDPREGVASSYLGLWSQYRRDRPALRLPTDMVFGR